MAEKRTFPILGKWLTAHFTSERRGVRKSRIVAERRKRIYDRRFNSGWARILKISVQELFKPRRKVSFP